MAKADAKGKELATSFVQSWMAEFSGALELSSGEAPKVELGSAAPRELESRMEEYLWWRQELQAIAPLGVHIGASESCWTAAVDKAQPDEEAEKSYFDLLSQATENAFKTLLANGSDSLRLGTAEKETLEGLEAALSFEILIEYHEVSLDPIILVFDRQVLELLDPTEKAMVVNPNGRGAANDSHMLKRLMDLHLPVAVLLGKATMPIREVLKLASGSLIELDKQLGDYVEVVVHGTVVARGEIVSIKGYYGVRIKEVISREDRYALKDAA